MPNGKKKRRDFAGLRLNILSLIHIFTSNSKYLTKKGTFELTTTGTKARYLVNDGYVIERAGVRSDGEPLYNVYYRLVLKNTDTMSAQYRKVEVKTESLKQPVPVISDEYEQDGDRCV